MQAPLRDLDYSLSRAVLVAGLAEGLRLAPVMESETRVCDGASCMAVDSNEASRVAPNGPDVSVKKRSKIRTPNREPRNYSRNRIVTKRPW